MGRKQLGKRSLTALAMSAFLLLQFSPLAFMQSSAVSQVVLSASPQSVPADGHTAAVLTAQVVGTSGVPLSGVSVTFATDLGTVASPGSGTTDSQGQVSIAVYSGTPGTATVTATAQGVAGTTTVDFYATGVVSVNVSASPSQVPADGTPATITAQALNGNGAPVVGVPVSFSTDSGNLGAPTTGVTNAQGVVTDTAYSDTPGTAALVTATAADGVSGNTTISFYAVSVSSVQVWSSLSDVPADGKTTATVTARVLNGGGQPVAGVPVNFTASLGTLAPPVSMATNAQGQVSAAVYSAAPGQATVTATAAGVSGTTTVDFYQVSVTEVQVGVSPYSVPADGKTTSAVTVQVLNGGGQPVAGVPVSLGTDLGTIASQGTGVTNVQGDVFAAVYSGTPGTATVTATAAGVSGTATVDFYATNVVSLQLSASPASVPADGTPATVTAEALDGNGDPVAGVPVSFSTDSGTLGAPTSGLTNAQGEVTDTVYSQAPGTAALITAATPNGVSGTTTVSFYAVSVSSVQAWAAPSNVPADGKTTAAVTARVLNGGGQPVVGTQVTFTTSMGILVQPSGVTNAQGQVSVAVYSGVAGTATVTATAAGVSGTAAVDFYATGATGLQVSASPWSLPADGQTTSTVTAQVLDGGGQPVAGVPVSFSTDLGKLVLPVSAVTNAQGQVLAAVYSNVVGTATVTAQAAGMSSTTTVDFYASGAASVRVWASPASVPADGTPSTVTAQVLNGSNDPVAGVPVSFSTDFGYLGAPTAGVTNSQGEVTDTVYADAPNTAALVTAATASGISGTTTVSFSAVNTVSTTVGSVPAWALPASVPADGKTASEVTAKVLDQNGNPMSDVPVSFRTTLGTLVPQAGVTDAQGEVSMAVYSATVGSATLTATAQGVSGTAQVVFYSVVPAKVQVWASSYRVPADGKTTAGVSVQVTDAAGYGLAGVSVTFKTDLGSLGQPGTMLTGAEGYVSDTIFSDTPGTAEVTVTASGVSGATTLSFYGLKSVAGVQAWAAPQTVPADGKTAATVTAQVMDTGGQPVSGVSVQFSTDLGTLVPPVSGATNAQGEVTAAVYSVTAGTATVTVTADGVAGTAGVTFYAPGPAEVQVGASPWNLPADGKTTATVTARVTDAAGDPLAGVPVTFRTDLGVLGNPATVATDTSGYASETITSGTVGTATVQATAGRVEGTTQVSFYSLVPARMQVGPPSQEVPADGTATGTVGVQVTDAAGDPLAGVPVTFRTNLGTLGQPATVATDASGYASDTIASSTVGMATVTAGVYGGLSGTAAVDFYAPGAVSSVQVGASPWYVPADGKTTATVAVQVLNAGGQPVSGVPVQFSTDLGTVIPPASGVTDQQGEVSAAVYSGVAGTATVTATALGLSGTAVLTFYAPGPAEVQVWASPWYVPADGKTTATVQARVTDAAGYGLAGVPVTFGTDLGVLGQPVTVETAASGYASDTISSGTTGTATVTAGVYGGPSGTAQVTFYSAAPAKVQVESGWWGPQEVPANGSATGTVTVQVTDAAGYGLAGVPVTFRTDLGTLGQPATVATDSGGYASDTVASDQVGTATVTAGVNGIPSATATVDFYAPGAASSVQVWASPWYVPADGKTTAVLTAQVVNAGGQPVPGVSVSFGTDLGTLVPPASGITNAQGEVTAALYSGTAGTATVTVGAANEPPSTAQVVFYPYSGTPAWVQVGASPGAVPADGKTTSTVTARVTDAAGYALAGVPVTFKTETNLGVLGNPVTVSTDAWGDASDTIFSATPGTFTVAAGVYGGPSGTTQVSFYSLVPAKVQTQSCWWWCSSQEVPANGSATGTVTMQVTDAAGYGLAGVPVTFKTDLGVLGNPLTVTTGSGGYVSETISSGAAGTATVTASVYGGISGTSTVDFYAVGAGSSVQVWASQGSVPADGKTTSTLTAQVVNAGGQPVPGVSVSFTTNLGTLVPPASGVTNAQGEVSAAVYSGVAGTATVTAEVYGGPSGTTTVDFQPYSGTPQNVDVWASPWYVPADGQSTATVQARVTDATGYALAGVPVTFQTDLGTLGQPVTVVTGSSGYASDTIASGQAGTATVTAGVYGGPSGTAQITFYSPVPAHLQGWVWPPYGAPANGSTTGTVGVRVTDAAGYGLAGVPVTFQTDLGVLGNPVTVATDSGGEASETISSGVAGTATVTASVYGGLSGTDWINFYAVGVGSRVQVWTSPWYVPADGRSTSTVSAQVVNAGGQPVPGVPVSFTTNLGTLVLPASGITNAQGEVTAAVYSATVGTATVTAVSQGLSGTGTVDFYSVVPAGVQVWASPTGVPADGKTATTVTARVSDAGGFAVPGAQVSFTTNLGTLVSPASGVTDAQGQVSATVYSGVAGTATVTAQVSGGPSGTAQITFYSLVPSQVQLFPASQNVPADGLTTGTVTAQVEDDLGYALPGVPVTFQTNLGTLGEPVTVVTGPGGQASDTIWSGTPGTATVTASIYGGISGTSTVDFYSAGVANSVQVRIAPTSIPADGKTTATVTATVLDGGGQAVPGVSVTFSTDLGGVGTLTGVTDQQGEVSDTVYSATAGTATVTVTTYNGKSGSATVTFWTGSKYLLFTSDPGTAAGSVWGKALPADSCSGSGCGSTSGQNLPWTFAQVTFLVNQPLATGDVYIIGSADANYDLRISATAPGAVANWSGPLSSGSTSAINLDTLGWFNEGGGQGRLVTVSLVAPAGAAGYGVGNVSVYATGGDQIFDLSTSGAPSVTLGGTTGIVGGTVSVPMSVASALLPINSITVGNGSDVSFNSGMLQFEGATGASGATMQSVSNPGSTNVSFALSAPAGLTAGEQAAAFNFTCLSAGTASVALSGGQFTTSQVWWAGGNLPSATAQVTCTAPDTPIGISGFTPGSVPQTTPGTGVPVQMNITGWGLNTAKTVTLVSQNGGAEVQGSIVSSAVYGGSLEVNFSSVPLGAYQVEVQEAGGATKAMSTGDFVVAPGIPMFTVTQQAFWSMAPGVPYQHTWTVSNQGLVPGVALIAVRFPAGVTGVPGSGTNAVYLGNGMALVAVPVAAGSAGSFSFSETLSPSAVVFPGQTPSVGATVNLGSLQPTLYLQVGSLTQAQWSGLATQPAPQLIAGALAETYSLDAQYQSEIIGMGTGAGSYLAALNEAAPAFAPPPSVPPLAFAAGNAQPTPVAGNGLISDFSSFLWNLGREGIGFSVGATEGALGDIPYLGHYLDQWLEPAINQAIAKYAPSLLNQPMYQFGVQYGLFVNDALDCFLKTGGVDVPAFAACMLKKEGKSLAKGELMAFIKWIYGLLSKHSALVVAGEDPNSIAAYPLGAGAGSYILNGQNLYVQVHFENSPKANAAAQNVRVDVQLGPNLGPTSVRLLSSSTASLPVMSVSPSGLVRFYFYNIDLPPDINPPAGEGMVEFQVASDPNLPDNTPLTVSANVYFDYNPPVATQALSYQIDAVTPTAAVAPLPAQSPADFSVSWSGTDPGGPGIADYNVLVSVNGGAYQPWLQDTTQTAAVYDGQPGDSYSFVVQAQDLLGQTQPLPTQAQASTTVAASAGGVAGGGGGGGGAPVATATAGTGVGPNGGTVTAGNGALTLDVPPGAFANQTSVTTQPLSTAQAYAPPGRAFAGASLQWSISAGGVQPAKPVLATFRYDASALGGLNPLRLGIYGYDPNTSAWQWVGGRVYASAGTVSAELNQFGTYAVFANTNSFSDLSQAGWARNAVDTLLGADLVAGVGPGVFDPNADLTRAQFTTLLVKADGLAPVASRATPFADVAATAWYAPYVAAAYKAGLVAGISPTSFDPNGDLTREQLAVMLAKLLGSGVPSGNLGRFTDASSIAPWARSGVAATVGAGLMSGYPDGAFQPTGISTRVQAAAVLAQYLAYVGKV